MRRLGFTLLEVVFVIVIMGILSKFGMEFLSQAYKNFIYSNVNYTLQANSAAAVESIAARLQYRIKDSIIARAIAPKTPEFQAVASSTLDRNATVLEWVGSDIEGFRGEKLPKWSGVIDLYNSETNLTQLKSPETNTTSLNNLIGVLSHSSGTDIDDAAIYFVGSNSNINTGYGWQGGGLTDHNTSVMHSIRRSTAAGEEDILIATNGLSGADNNFSGTDIYEYYQLAWTAYAVEHNTSANGGNNNLTLYYDYQPWKGEAYTTGKSFMIMENVDTFRFKAIGSVVKIQVCVTTDLIQGDTGEGGYSLCKEKTIY